MVKREDASARIIIESYLDGEVKLRQIFQNPVDHTLDIVFA